MILKLVATLYSQTQHGVKMERGPRDPSQS